MKLKRSGKSDENTHKVPNPKPVTLYFLRCPSIRQVPALYSLPAL
jgi:hypothetical protein